MKKNGDRVLFALAVAGLMALATGCASSESATPTPTVTLFIVKTREAPALAFDKRQVELGCDAVEAVEGSAEM